MSGARPEFGGVLAVAGALQGASTQNEITGAYLDTIPGAVHASGYGVYILDPANLQPLNVAATVPDEFLDLYETEGRHDDPVLQEAVENRAPIDSSRLRRSWESSAVMSVLADAGYYHSMEAPIIVDGQIHGTLNMARSRTDEPFSAEDLATMGILAEQVGGSHKHARRAVPALEAVVGAEALLQRVELAAPGQPLDRLYLCPVGLGRQQNAALHQLAVEDDRAGSATAGVAADVGPGKIKGVP